MRPLVAIFVLLSAFPVRAQTPEIDTFNQALQKNPSDAAAVAGLARAYLQAGERRKAREYFLRNTELNPLSARAFYEVGAVDWAIAFEGTPETPDERWQLIDEGMRYIDIVLGIDQQYLSAMGYKNLLLREEAKLTLDREERTRLIAEADSWLYKAMSVKKDQQQRQPPRVPQATPSPPPPPPPPARLPLREAPPNLLFRPTVTYPQEALKLRLEGSVVMEALVSQDGAVESLRLISGHPLLNEAALENAKQWRFKPTLLNGKPINVVTTVTIEFRLP